MVKRTRTFRKKRKEKKSFEICVERLLTFEKKKEDRIGRLEQNLILKK